MVEHATESTKVREDTKAALAIGFLILVDKWRSR
jgi:hypothetical protein